MTIKARRRQLKLKANDVAEKIGVKERTVRAYEQGERMPDVEMLPGLSEILDVSVGELVHMLIKGRRR